MNPAPVAQKAVCGRRRVVGLFRSWLLGFSPVSPQVLSGMQPKINRASPSYAERFGGVLIKSA